MQSSHCCSDHGMGTPKICVMAFDMDQEVFEKNGELHGNFSSMIEGQHTNFQN